MEPPAQAWQTLHICSTTSLSYCGERGISPRADTSSPWASASCLHTSTYGLPFKNGNAAGKPDSLQNFFFFCEVITASKTSGGELTICYPTNLSRHLDCLGQVLSWKHSMRQNKETGRTFPYHVRVTSKRPNTESNCDVATCVIFKEWDPFRWGHCTEHLGSSRCWCNYHSRLH